MSGFLEHVAVALVLETGKQVLNAPWRAFEKWRFRRFFGADAVSGDRFFCVLDPVSNLLPPGQNRYIKRTAGGRPDTHLIGPNEVLGLNAIRIVSYASALFARFRAPESPVPFAIDYDVANRWDATFICFGSSYSNLKTFDIERLPEQKCYSVGINDSRSPVLRVGNRDFGVGDQFDHGIVLRLMNPKHQEHALFVCFGLGEWGTSGAAYFLFHNWKALLKKHGLKDFCKVVKVQANSDDSATEVFSIPD